MDHSDFSFADKIRYVQDTLYVVQGKWKLPLLMALHEGPKRFRDMKRAIPGITTRVLSKELKELEANHLLQRTADAISIEYALTPYTYRLAPLVNEMIAFGYAHRQQVMGRAPHF